MNEAISPGGRVQDGKLQGIEGHAAVSVRKGHQTHHRLDVHLDVVPTETPLGVLQGSLDNPEKGSNWALVCAAINRAREVFPDPGGPQRIRDDRVSCSMASRSGRPGPRTSSCPTSSSSDRGRIRSARGPGRLFSSCWGLKRSTEMRIAEARPG